MSTTAPATATEISGIVKWFNAAKGYGFIIPNDGSKELFVHFKDIIAPGYKALNEGDRVVFNKLEDVKGRKATNVIVYAPNGPRAIRPAHNFDR